MRLVFCMKIIFFRFFHFQFIIKCNHFSIMDSSNDKNFSLFIKNLREETQKCQKKTANPKIPVSNVPILKKMNNEIDKYSIPKELLPEAEWSHNLVQWFGHVRFGVGQIKKQNDTEAKNSDTDETPNKKIVFSDITKLIEKGELPTADIITNINDASGILFYFKKRHSDFSHSDLCWIFSALTRLDLLMLPDMCECIQIISSIIRKQICEGGDKNPLYPYLTVVNDLIVKYFHQY